MAYTVSIFLFRLLYECQFNFRHWDTFYTRGDLEILYESGISHLRIPVGYWMVDVAEGEPFPPPVDSDESGMRLDWLKFPLASLVHANREVNELATKKL